MLSALTLATSLAVSLACLVVLFRTGVRNGLFVVGAFFVLFAYGPAVNIVLGAPFFFGINLATTTGPVIGFALAMLALTAAHLLIRQRLDINPAPSTRDYLLLPWLLALTTLYGALVLVTRGSEMIGQNKIDAVAVAGPFHYPYLLLQILAVSTAFLCRTRLAKTLWLVNLPTYLAYSLATAERDFIFVLAVLLLHREVRLNKNRSARAILLASGAITVATVLAAGRSVANTTSIITNVLNQGSILFIDSHIHRLVPEEQPFRGGETYLMSLLRPLGVDDSLPLSEWFVYLYAPGSPSGYGFSLTGEAYLNFGFYAIPVVFFVLAVIQRVLMNGVATSDFRCYLSVVYMVALLYALRGDSAQIVSMVLYAVVLFSLLWLSRVDILKVSHDRSLRAALAHDLAEYRKHAPAA